MKNAVFLFMFLFECFMADVTAQTVVTNETFPNSFNTSFSSSNNSNSTFVGSSGTWTSSVNSNSLAAIAVIPPYFSPVTNAIKIVNWNTAGAGAADCHAASPAINLSGYTCSPNIDLAFKLYTYTCSSADANSFLKVEFSIDNGANWTSVWSRSSAQLFSSYGANGITNISVSIPSAYRTSLFKYRFSGYKPANQSNNFYLFIDDAKITAVACAAGSASIGNRVWNDVNANGIQDASETAGLTGVTVKLKNSTGTVISTTNTDASGNYLFPGLAAGSYQVEFPTKLSTSTLTPANIGTNDNIDSDPNQATGLTSLITLIAGQANTSIDAGYCPTTLSLGNRVWYDADNNGLLSNENGIADATVLLYKDNNNDDVADGAAIATQNTDANGYYLFQNLVPGNYIVGVAIPNGYVSSSVNAGDPDNNTNLDDNGQVLVGNEIRGLAITLVAGNEPDGGGDSNISYDFGLLPDCGCTNSSSNLIVNPGFENGTTGWNWNSANGTFTTGTGYLACGTKNGFNVNNSGTSKVWQDVNMGAGSMVTFSAFAGTHTPGISCSPKLSLIFLNASNTIIGQTDIAVTRDVDVNHNQLEQYTISALAPSGTVKARVQSSINCDYMKLDAFCVTATAPPTFTIGNNVWYDIDLNGVKDSGEPGIQGVVVKLYDCAGNYLNKTVTTDVNGSYQLTGVSTGSYIVGVMLTAGYLKTDAGITSVTLDNQNDGVNLAGNEVRTNCFVITGSTNNIDFGLKGNSTIGDFVWNDLNGNGLQDSGEPGIKGAVVKLTMPNGTVLTTTTNANGNYSFTNLAPGTYTVTFVTPAYYNPSFENVGSNNNIDSDPVNGKVTVTITGTQVNNTVDAGFSDDIDDDDDGIIDMVEGHGYDGLKDFDGDGIPNYMDPTPGCPTPAGTDIYGNPYQPIIWRDCARSGFPNGDGINDFFDFDHDGIIDQLDLDSDNDGIPDVTETQDPNMVDANQDGKVDGGDADRDGLMNSADKTPNVYGGPGLTPRDMDRDGLPNYTDLDSDGDGLSDLTEARGFFDNDGIADGTDSDKDGVNDIYDQIAGSGALGVTVLDNDNDGKLNPYDIDSDNDGITDNVEGQPTCSYKAPTGIDSDGDGMDDAYDSFNSTCTLKAPGITPYDKDGDGTPDMYDLDTDNDGALDINEGSGIGGNFVSNFADADGDGLIDQFDIFNNKAATAKFSNNVLHSNMGANGSFDGPLPAGSNARLPQTATGNCSTGADRDWRDISILPVTLVNFAGNSNLGKTELTWKVASEQHISNYTIERSTNGQAFTALGKVNARGTSALNTVYNYNDDGAGVTAATVYYRLKMIETDGTYKYSNVLSFKVANKGTLSFGFYPNPANSYLQVKINAQKDGMGAIRIVDGFGKIIFVTNTRISTGANIISLNNISTLPSGMYNVQLLTEGQTLNQKLVIAR